MKPKNKLLILFFFFALTGISCNNSLFIKKDKIVRNTIGLLVIQKKNSLNSDFQNKDSSFINFFIEAQFPNRVLTKEDIDQFFQNNHTIKIHNFRFLNDCDNYNNENLIKNGIKYAVKLPEDIYSFKDSVSIVPVSFNYIYYPLFNPQFYYNASTFTINFDSTKTKAYLQKGEFHIYQFNILLGNWNASNF